MSKNILSARYNLSLIATLSVGGAIGAGYLIRGYYHELTKSFLLPEIESVDWKNHPTPIVDPALKNELYFLDSNKDGIVDAIGSWGSAIWYTQDWKKAKVKGAYPLEMTPEIRNKATEIMNAQRDLGRLLLEERWRQIEGKE